MSAISATPEVILGFSFYSLAQVCGIFNVLYALRFDLLYRAWAPRNAITTVAQLFLSASHAVSFYYGYEYQKHYVENPDFYEDGLRISDQFFIFGAFLLLYALQALLPAIQGKLRYDPKWNIALKAVNAGTFFICLIGHVVSTIIIVRAERNGGKADDSVLQLRTLFFTAWAIYAPVMMILIAIMVSFMVLAAKKQLAAAGVTVEKALHSDDQENGTPRETAAEILESIKKKTLWSTCICIPLTIGVAGYTAGPYSVIADGVATFYTALFCSWLHGNIYVIRQVVLYSPSASAIAQAGNQDDVLTTDPPPRRLRGMSAVRASNLAQAQSKTLDGAASGGSNGGTGSYGIRESVGKKAMGMSIPEGVGNLSGVMDDF